MNPKPRHFRRLLLAAAMAWPPMGFAGCDALEVLTHDTTPPVVAITGIASGATIIDPTPVTVTAHDAESDITRVHILLDGNEIIDTNPGSQSYAQGMTLLTGRENAGHHNLTVEAVDAAGNRRNYGIVYEVFAP